MYHKIDLFYDVAQWFLSGLKELGTHLPIHVSFLSIDSKEFYPIGISAITFY